MQIRIEDCYFELIKDLLNSYSSLVQDVQKEENGAIVTLQNGHSQMELVDVLSHEPLFQFCKNSTMYVV